MTTVSSYTPQQFGELRRCAHDFKHFCTYVKIRYPQKGLVQFKPYDYQLQLVKAQQEKKHVICTKFRQGGFTTLAAVYSLWKCLFDTDRKVAFVCPTYRQATEAYRIACDVLSELPAHLKTEITQSDQECTSFLETNSTLRFVSPNRLPDKTGTPNGLVGKSITDLVLDEAAFFGDTPQPWLEDRDMHWDEISSLVQSTPNGDQGWFFKTFMEACDNRHSRFFVFSVDHKSCPRYQDESFCQELQRTLGSHYQQEVLAQFACMPKPEPVKEDIERVEPQVIDLNPQPHNKIHPHNLNIRKVHPHNWINPSPAQVKKVESKIYDVENKPVILCCQGPDPMADHADIPDFSKARGSDFKPEQFNDCAYLSGLETPPDEALSQLDAEPLTEQEIAEIAGKNYTVEPEPEPDEKPEFECLDKGGFDQEEVDEMWKNISEVWPESKSLKKMWKRDKSPVDFCLSDEVNPPAGLLETLKLAGVVSGRVERIEDISEDEHDENKDFRNMFLRMLVDSEMPTNMKVGLDEKSLCVNGVPTRISAKGIEMAFMGLAELTTPNDALTTVGSLVRNKLRMLF